MSLKAVNIKFSILKAINPLFVGSKENAKSLVEDPLKLNDNPIYLENIKGKSFNYKLLTNKS